MTDSVYRLPPVFKYGLGIMLVLVVMLPLWLTMTPPTESSTLDGSVMAHVTTNLMIGVAYIVISATILIAAREAGQRIPFLWVFFAFGAFIIACGLGHLADAIKPWHGWLWLAGAVNLITMVASVATAIAIPGMMPRFLALVRASGQLQDRNRELDAAMCLLQAHREQLQAQVDSQEQDIATLIKQLSQRNVDLTQELQDRERFLSLTSHELKTPLTSIRATAQLVRRTLNDEIELSPRIQRLLDQHESQTLRLDRLVNDLLDISRISEQRLTLQIVEMPVAEALNNIIMALADGTDLITPKHHIIARCDPGLIVRADLLRFEQIVTNLLTNAFKYSPDGGRVSLYAGVKDEQFSVTVTDEGIGMDTATLANLFQPFARGEEAMMRGIEGSGLGLYLVRQMASYMGGTIEAESTPGKGTTITYRRPANLLHFIKDEVAA